MSAPSNIGRYEILRPLGKGAMGIVYLARDPQIEREVALKTVRFDQPGHMPKVDEAKARFLKEAKISGRLQHPHIVTVYDVGEDEGSLYLAMEYVKGGSLAQRLLEPVPLDLVDRIRIVVEVAEALGHAHERGVLHRDIKPANILLTESLSAKVSDFGIGKLLTGDTDLTSTGQMVGSPAYMSPEQIRGEKLDARSDIFSLGVVLYQSIALRKPFPADTLTTLVYQILHEEPADPVTVREDLPPELSAVVRHCLAKNREDRYRDALEVASELGGLIGMSATGSTATLSESKIKRAVKANEPPAPPAVTVFGPRASQAATVVTPLKAIVPPVPPLPPAATPLAARSSAAARNAGIAALVLAAALGVAFLAWRSSRGGGIPVPPATPTPVPAAVPVPAAETPVPATGTPAANVTPVPSTATQAPSTATAPAAQTPAPLATRAPRVRPSPTSTPAPVPTEAPTPVPAKVVYTVRRYLRLRVTPDQARVFVDGKYAGIADDWDDSGGGSLLTWNLPGRHRVRIAYPGYEDLTADIHVEQGAKDEKVELEEKLVTGTPSGPTGPAGKLGRPAFRTVGPVRFEVEPPGAVLSVNGREWPAASFREVDMLLGDMAVYEVVLSAPGYDSRALRILASPAAGSPRVVVREKLKKKK